MSGSKGPARILGVLLLVAGTYGLVYHGVTYTKETHTADLGPVQLQLDEKERVQIPQWMAVSGIVLGAFLLLSQRKT